MALKKEALTKLKETLKGFDVDKLITAVTATDEQDYEIPADHQVLTTAELTTRDENMKKVGKVEGKTEGETIGKEITVKKVAKKLGLDEAVIGNDIDKLEVAAQAKFKAGDAGLQQQVTALIQDKDKLTQENASLKTTAESAMFDSTLISMFPAGRTADLSDAERLVLIKNAYQFEKTAEGKMVVKKDGVVIANPADHSPLPLKDVLTNVFTERKWAGAAAGGGEGGRGGGNQGGAGGGTAGVKKLSAFTEAWKVNNVGKNHVSPEFDADLQKHVKDIPDFDYGS